MYFFKSKTTAQLNLNVNLFKGGELYCSNPLKAIYSKPTNETYTENGVTPYCKCDNPNNKNKCQLSKFDICCYLYKLEEWNNSKSCNKNDLDTILLVGMQNNCYSY